MQVRDRWNHFREQNADALVISFAPPDALKDYRDHLRLPFPISTDPGRLAYRAYGVGRGPGWRIWSPRVLWQYVRLVARGHKLQKPREGEDLSQLGGDFIIDAEGRLRYAHVCRSPADRPSVDRLLRALDDESTLCHASLQPAQTE